MTALDTPALDIHATVGSLVAASPNRSRVFEQLGIDYCCGGKKPLSEVCAQKELDAGTVLRMLAALDHADAAGASGTPADAAAMPLTALCDHIVATHHAYLRQELPRLDFMTHKVSDVHGDKDARLRSLRKVFVAFQAELASHMAKEEQILFPLIRQLDAGTDLRAVDGCGLDGPIAQMEHEHAAAGDALARMRDLTDGYTPPDWACNTFRAMYDALRRLEQDMHQHVHKENNVLFPRAMRLAAS
jgi:regulator of cell morphogenesis and NO signaling